MKINNTPIEMSTYPVKCGEKVGLLTKHDRFMLPPKKSSLGKYGCSSAFDLILDGCASEGTKVFPSEPTR